VFDLLSCRHSDKSFINSVARSELSCLQGAPVTPISSLLGSGLSLQLAEQKASLKPRKAHQFYRK